MKVRNLLRPRKINLDNWSKPQIVPFNPNSPVITMDDRFSDESEGIPLPEKIERPEDDTPYTPFLREGQEVETPSVFDENNPPLPKTMRPRIFGNATQPVMEAEPNYQNDIANLQRDYDQLKNTRVVNENPGFKGRLTDIAREAVFGGGSVASRGGSFAEILGGILTGGAIGGFKPTMHEERQQKQKLNDLQEQIQQKQRLADWIERQKISQTNRANIEADNINNANRVDEMTRSNKAKETARRRSDLIRLGNQGQVPKQGEEGFAEYVTALKEVGLPYLPETPDFKFEQYVDHRTGKVYVQKADKKSGNVEYMELTNDDGTPFTVYTDKMLASADKAKQRELDEKLNKANNITKINVANIMGQYGIARQQYQNAGNLQQEAIRQEGQNQRHTETINFNRDKFQQMLQQKNQALQQGNTNKAQQIDLQIKNARINAKKAGFSEDEINQMFGGN